MKPSHTQTPRTLDECHFTPGYRSVSSREPLSERIGGYALAVVIGTVLAACLFVGWSA